MIAWIIECIILACIFLGLYFIGDKICSLPTKEARSRACHWLIIIAVLLGELWLAIIEKIG